MHGLPSGVLELIAPDAATRRDYLAKHFEGPEPGPTHERLAQLAHDGLVKVFITTADFLADLERRLAVFRAHPTGHLPHAVNDEVLLLLRRGDDVGLGEVMRRERRAFDMAVDEFIGANRQTHPTSELAVTAHDDLLPVLERRLAGVLPLALYSSDRFREEIRSLADFKERQPRHDGYTFWPEIVDWVIWWLGYTLGAFALRHDRLDTISALLAEETSNRYDTREPLVQTMPGSAGHEIGTAAMVRDSPQSWLSPAWEALNKTIAANEFIAERYPEYLSVEEISPC